MSMIVNRTILLCEKSLKNVCVGDLGGTLKEIDEKNNSLIH
jgi:hypothetical protein